MADVLDISDYRNSGQLSPAETPTTETPHPPPKPRAKGRRSRRGSYALRASDDGEAARPSIEELALRAAEKLRSEAMQMSARPPPRSREREEPSDLRDGADRATSARVSEHVTREELNDKLALAEARTETRFVLLDAKLDKLNGALTDKGGLLDQLAEARAQVRTEASTTRLTIAGIFIGTIVAAIAALWTTQANLLAAFQAALAIKH